MSADKDTPLYPSRLDRERLMVRINADLLKRVRENSPTLKMQDVIEDALRLWLNQNNLEIALEESVKLQSHYAALLNMHDGGERLQFTTAEEWIDRLVEIGQLKRDAKK